jgi:hypothetical protein
MREIQLNIYFAAQVNLLQFAPNGDKAMFEITNSIFSDDKAREHLEAQRWLDGARYPR